MLASGDDFAVSLDRDLLADERHLLDQRADREGLLEALRRTVDGYLNHRAILPLALAITSGGVFAADAAYQVDSADVATPGSSKVEAWLSASQADDIIAAVNPAYVADLPRPVQASAQFARLRSEDDYTSTVTPKLKINLLPTGIGKLGAGIGGGVTYDSKTDRIAAASLYVPATYRLSHWTRVNVNLGWLRDRVLEQDHATYGVGVDLRTGDNVWTLTGEVFGQAVKPAPPGANQPRYQLGMRWRPVDQYSIDLVYGRNLIGEERNWLTLATVVRFR